MAAVPGWGIDAEAAIGPARIRTAQQIVAADQAEASVLTAEWLQELEAAAIANWSKLMGQ